MLKYNPRERMTAKEALNDPWIQKNAPLNQINTNVLKNLSSFFVIKQIL
jgi:calcium-dependent protein kinase